MKNHQWGFAPRIGIAWNPLPKLTVRTGFGIYYDRGEFFSYLSPSAGGGFNGPFGVTLRAALCFAHRRAKRRDALKSVRDQFTASIPLNSGSVSGFASELEPN